VNRWCDRVVLGGVLILLLVTPLAFGSVHPWAFSLLEIVIFLLASVWAVRTLGMRSEEPFSAPLRPFLTPLILLVGVVLWQLCPLPPPVLRMISPATYTLYSHVLPGWPQRVLYNEPINTSSQGEEPAEWVVLPTPSEVTQQEAPPRADALPTDSAVAQETAATLVHTWRSLSPAPMLTRTALLKLIAYVTLFALVVGYPVGRGGPGRQRDAEARFFRAVVLTILFSGGVVAILGIVQCFSWNGKLLWFFVPYDWRGAQAVATLRAQGPFVNYSHFANYLAVIFPLTLTATVFPLMLVPAHIAWAFRLLWGSVSFFIGVGILLSNSRGGWIGLLLGSGIVLWGRAAHRATGTSTGRSPLRVALLSLVMTVLALAFVGVSARKQMDLRLDDTLQGEVSGMTRVMLWADTATMIRDFPVWGVGLGAWSTVFPHYQRPMLAGGYFREAHNDYVELVAETGVVGLGLFAWFLVLVVKHLRHGLLATSATVRPLFIAFGGAISVMAIHEMIDFNLQIPAIAALFTIMLGLAVRLAHREVREKEGTIVSASQTAHHVPAEFITPVWDGGGWERWRQGALAVGVSGGACALIVLALQQEQRPYPYNLHPPTSLSKVRASIHAYPTHVPFHLAFARLVPQNAPVILRQSALEAALWVEPGHAYARDLYAATLFRQGKKKEGLEQTSLSVFYTPEGAAHIYLRPRIVPWLPPEEQAAIEEGLRRALAVGKAGAQASLGQFYASLGRFFDQAVVYEEAARAESRVREQASWLLQASQAYDRAKDARKAEQALRAAVALTPSEPHAYQQLVNHLAATAPNLDAAKVVVAEGIGNGIDPFELWLGFAAAAQSKRDFQEAKDALSQALTIRPESLEAHVRLGHLYLQERNFDRAALIWRKATDLDPSAASAFYHLGVAERGRYRFFEAEKAFLQALTLQPNDLAFQREYTALRELMEKRTSRRKDRGLQTEDRLTTAYPVLYSLVRPENLRFFFPTAYCLLITDYSSLCVG
jgi:tetratricopeptide (TPR) repeat protein/O-antigen ligase